MGITPITPIRKASELRKFSGWLCYILLLLKFTSLRPADLTYPGEPSTIGEHIRKARLERGLTFHEASKHMDIPHFTICTWEMGHKHPRAEYYPRIISFLGYIPLKKESEDAHHVFLYYRLLLGLARKDVAKMLGVSYCTVLRFEEQELLPLGRKMMHVLYDGLRRLEEMYIVEGYTVT